MLARADGPHTARRHIAALWIACLTHGAVQLVMGPRPASHYDRGEMPRRIGVLIALLVLLAGAVFALQGLRLLPSPTMYGRPEWVVIGVVMVIASVISLVWLARR